MCFPTKNNNIVIFQSLFSNCPPACRYLQKQYNIQYKWRNMSEYLARGLAPIVWVCQVSASLLIRYIVFTSELWIWRVQFCNEFCSPPSSRVWDNDWKCQIIYYFMIKLSGIGSYLQLLTTRCHQMHQPTGPSWEFTKIYILWSSENFSERASAIFS